MSVALLAVRLDHARQQQVLDLAGDVEALLELTADPEFSVPDRCLDLDAMWHVVHTVLSGTPAADGSPLSDAVLGGRLLTGDEDGPRLLDAPQVRATASALRHVDPARLVDAARARPDLVDPDVVYRGEDLADDAVPAQVEALIRDVAAFYAAAAAAGDSVFVIFP